MTISELRKQLDSKDVSSAELTEQYLANIAAANDKLSAYITVCAEQARAAAKKADERIAKGEADALTGIPLAIKDNICMKGAPTTCASKMLEHYCPPYHATATEKLLAQDAVVLGKTNMDEFAMGGSSQTSYFGGVKNPYDTERVAGGSSGGSAAAVSANLCAAALGSDTGGSIRQPAAFCGVTGLKPTYGTVSRYGLVAFASSLDQIGPIANSAEDCAVLLNAIKGKDKHDQTSRDTAGLDYTARIGKSVKGMMVGLPAEFFGDGIDEEVKTAVMEAAKFFEQNGAVLKEVHMPTLKFAVSAYYLLACAEASSNLARFDGVKYGFRAEGAESYDQLVKLTRSQGFGEEVKRRILLGTYALSSGYYDAYYKKAMAVRQQFRREHAELFETCDVLLTPTAPTTAYLCGENIDDPVKMYAADICTVTANIVGIPSVSTICGYDSKGLPIGFSIAANHFQDATAVQFADCFERGFTRQPAEM